MRYSRYKKPTNYCKALWRCYSAIRFVLIIICIIIFLYVFPPYRIKQVFDQAWSAATTIGLVVHAAITSEQQAQRIVTHSLKTGRAFWTHLVDEVSNDIPKL